MGSDGVVELTPGGGVVVAPSGGDDVVLCGALELGELVGGEVDVELDVDGDVVGLGHVVASGVVVVVGATDVVAGPAQPCCTPDPVRSYRSSGSSNVNDQLLVPTAGNVADRPAK